jgi:glycosyltransferase involved in cell wall biosynthesis
MARPNIEFLGRIPDEEVRYHFAHCKALIFPGEEDFGLTPVEAQASGRPVIAYAAGGALETIQDKQTGLFFHEQTPESLAEAVTRFSGYSFNSDVIRENALKFDESVFKRELAEYISAKIEEFHTDHH